MRPQTTTTSIAVMVAAMVIIPAITQIPASKDGITGAISAAYTIRNHIIIAITGIVTTIKTITGITTSDLSKISTFQSATFDPIQNKGTARTTTDLKAGDISDRAISTGGVSVLDVVNTALSGKLLRHFSCQLDTLANDI